MEYVMFPVIDPEATGRNIQRLRQQRGLPVRALQAYFGFTEPQAIYKWQSGRSLPTVDNLLALSALLGVPMDRILVVRPNLSIAKQQAKPAASCFCQTNTAVPSKSAVSSTFPVAAHSQPRTNICRNCRGAKLTMVFSPRPWPV